MDIFAKPIKALTFFGFWPDKNTSKLHLVMVVVVRLIFVEMYLMLAVIFLSSVESVEDFTKSIGVTPIYLVSVVKSVNFVCNRNKILKLYESLKALVESDSWIEKQKAGHLKRRKKQFYRVFKLFMVASMYGVLMSSIVIFTEHELPIKMWFPYDYKESESFFYMSAAYQMVGGFFMTPISIIVETFPVFFISFLTGIVEELQVKLENVCENKNVFDENIFASNLELKSLKNQTELGSCVKIHEQIIEITSKVNEIFGRDFWFQGFISTFVLCTTSFTLTIVSFE